MSISDHDLVRRRFLTAAPASAVVAYGAIAAAQQTVGSEAAIESAAGGGASSVQRLPREVRIATVSLDGIEADSPAGMVVFLQNRGARRQTVVGP